MSLITTLTRGLAAAEMEAADLRTAEASRTNAGRFDSA
jgi:hypothetical protein